MANINGTRSVKLKAEIVEKVEKNKKKTGVPIAVFFEQAAEEKLKSAGKKRTIIQDKTV